MALRCQMLDTVTMLMGITLRCWETFKSLRAIKVMSGKMTVIPMIRAIMLVAQQHKI